MKKKITRILLISILISVLFTGFAYADNPKVTDECGIFSQTELDDLNLKAQQLSEKYGCDFDVLFIPSTYGKSIEAYADDYFDYNGYGYGPNGDGIMFVVAVNDREYAITTQGAAIDAFTDYGLRKIEENIIPYLSSSNWYKASDAFLSACDQYYKQYESGTPYDINNEVPKGFSLTELLACLGIGAASSGIPLANQKKKLTSVTKQANASNYIKDNTFRLTVNRDYFINKSVSRIPIPRVQNSGPSGGSSLGGGSTIHMSSSGHMHGGTHGHF